MTILKCPIYYFELPNTSGYPIWVTAAPFLQQKCQDLRFGRREGLDLRLFPFRNKTGRLKN